MAGTALVSAALGGLVALGALIAWLRAQVTRLSRLVTTWTDLPEAVLELQGAVWALQAAVRELQTAPQSPLHRGRRHE